MADISVVGIQTSVGMTQSHRHANLNSRRPCLLSQNAISQPASVAASELEVRSSNVLGHCDQTCLEVLKMTVGLCLPAQLCLVCAALLYLALPFRSAGWQGSSTSNYSLPLCRQQTNEGIYADGMREIL